MRSIIKARCALAGVEGHFPAHSLRSGFVTEAGRSDVPLGDAMAMVAHTRVALTMRYFPSGTMINQPAARLLDLPDSDESVP